MNVGELAQAHERHVVLVHIADDPHFRQIRDGEQIRGIVQRLHARRRGHLLIGDHARDRRMDLDNRTRMIQVGAQHLQMLHRGLDGHLGLDVGVLGHFLVLFAIAPLSSSSFERVQLRLGQGFVRHRLPVIGKSLRDVLALHLQQQLALGHRVAQPRIDLHDPAGSQRNHRNVSRNIGAHRAGGLQLRRGVMLARRHDRKLLGMIHAEHAAIRFVDHIGRRRRSQLGIGFHFLAATRQNQARGQTRHGSHGDDA